MKFKVGDKIRIKEFKKRPEYWNNEGKMDHLMGKVVSITEVLRKEYKVYDEVHKRSWYIREQDFKPVNETIVIYRKDLEVIALNKSTGKKAIARCCPEDTFDFETGAKLAFDRLWLAILEEPEEPKKQLYNGKIIFTKGDEIFKTGHIYEIKDGRIKIDHCTYPLDKPFKDIDDVEDYFTDEAKGRNGCGWSGEDLELIEVQDD